MTEIKTRLTKDISDGKSKILLLTNQNAEADRELQNEISNKNLALQRVAYLENKLKRYVKQLEEKESEISKLKKQHENQAQLHSQQQQQWNKTLQQGYNNIEFLQAENIKLLAQNNQLGIRLHGLYINSSQMENELRASRVIAGQSIKFQSDAKQLENQLAEEKKKTKDLNSEYEMLLSEKDALIVQYVSGKDSKYFSHVGDIDNVYEGLMSVKVCT